MTLTAYDPTLARLSAIAYLSYSQAADAAAELSFGIRDYFDSDGAQGYLFENFELAFLCFRGTEASRGSIGDIASNIRFLAREWDGPGHVHLGVARQFRRIRPWVHEAMDDVPTEKALIAGGHSLGGDIGNVFAVHAGAGNHPLAALVTFGAPKSLGRDAVPYIKCPVRRYVNRYDFAPHWPPTPFLVHPGPAIMINSGGWPGPVSRHFPPRYVKAMDRRFKK